MYVCMYVRLCVCVCVHERERERERLCADVRRLIDRQIREKENKTKN